MLHILPRVERPVTAGWRSGGWWHSCSVPAVPVGSYSSVRNQTWKAIPPPLIHVNETMREHGVGVGSGGDQQEIWSDKYLLHKKRRNRSG